MQESVLPVAHNLVTWLRDLLFPPRCVGCRQVGVWLCDECLDQIPHVESPVCARCGGVPQRQPPLRDGLCAHCRAAPLQIDDIRSVVYFEGVLRKALHRFKYGQLTALASPLSDLITAYWMQHPLPVDVIVPVPLHTTRLRERGYNQSALLAREMARQIGLMVDERTLIRQRATAPQVELGARQRKENVRDAFLCSSDALAGKQVLLIDDVCTTGATLEACAVAVQEGGARSVRALTLARAR